MHGTQDIACAQELLETHFQAGTVITHLVRLAQPHGTVVAIGVKHVKYHLQHTHCRRMHVS